MDSPPLIIGVTGHFGAGRTTVSEYLCGVGDGFQHIQMSALLDEAEDRHMRVAQLQEQGDQLRKEKGADAVARIAVDCMGSCDAPGYVIDGIKNPDEARLFSGCGRFYLVAVQASEETRWSRVENRVGDSRDEFDRIKKKDHREVDRWGIVVPSGQRVADCIPLADAMVWNDRPPVSMTGGGNAATLAKLRDKIGRLYGLMVQPQSVAPSVMEVRMVQAFAIARLSSCLQRQVGAVITDSEGHTVLSDGWNEVPEGSEFCGDEFGMCYRAQLRESDLTQMAELFLCRACGSKLDEELRCQPCERSYKDELTSRKNLDYCRALHAEEEAILQSRKQGVALDGTTMFVTTYPCALCAKKIVSSGIKTVIFAEPYDVPEAEEFFRQAGIEVRAFEGFTPRSFERAFGQA